MTPYQRMVRRQKRARLAQRRQAEKARRKAARQAFERKLWAELPQVQQQMKRFARPRPKLYGREEWREWMATQREETAAYLESVGGNADQFLNAGHVWDALKYAGLPAAEWINDGTTRPDYLGLSRERIVMEKQTRVTFNVVRPTTLATKPFSEFGIGDYLVVPKYPETAGIKVGERTIKFLHGGSCDRVPASTRYIVPASVNVEVRL